MYKGNILHAARLYTELKNDMKSSLPVDKEPHQLVRKVVVTLVCSRSSRECDGAAAWGYEFNDSGFFVFVCVCISDSTVDKCLAATI